MDANQRHASSRQSIAPHGEAWAIVESWPNCELSAEAKLAWQRVWLANGMKFDGVMCHQATVVRGAADPNRSGKRALHALLTTGLIQIDLKNPPQRGQWSFVLRDPAEVKRDRIAKFSTQATEHQGEFFEEPEARAEEEAATIPLMSSTNQTGGNGATGAVTKVSEGADEIPLSRSTVNEGIDLGNGSSGTTAAGLQGLIDRRDRAERYRKPESGPEPISPYVQALAHSVQLARENRPNEVRRIVAKVTKAVEDPNLYRSKVELIAWEIVDGRYHEKYLDGVLRSLREVRRQWADPQSKNFGQDTPKRRGQYFNASMEESFRVNGLQYKDARSPPIQTRADGEIIEQPADENGEVPF